MRWLTGGGGGWEVVRWCWYIFPQIWPGLWRQCLSLLPPRKYWRPSRLRLRKFLWRFHLSSHLSALLQRRNRRWGRADRANPVRFSLQVTVTASKSRNQIYAPKFCLKLRNSEWHKPANPLLILFHLGALISFRQIIVIQSWAFITAESGRFNCKMRDNHACCKYPLPPVVQVRSTTTTSKPQTKVTRSENYHTSPLKVHNVVLAHLFPFHLFKKNTVKGKQWT